MSALILDVQHAGVTDRTEVRQDCRFFHQPKILRCSYENWDADIAMATLTAHLSQLLFECAQFVSLFYCYYYPWYSFVSIEILPSLPKFPSHHYPPHYHSSIVLQ